MGQQSLLKFETFFHFGIFILIFTFLVESVPLPDWRYEACKPRNCGSGPNISYPFQLIDDRAYFCGYPGFSVVCEENKPVYATSGSKYIIEDIFYTNQSFKLVDVEVINSTCPIPLRIFAFDRSSFEFGPNFIDLYLFYNCSNSFPVKYKQFPIACASNPSYCSVAVLDPKDESFNVTDMPCESFTSAPVELEGGTYDRKVQTVDYKKLLTNGFTLEWSGIRCTECERSGGHCGFNNSDTLCFCPDGPHLKRCTDGTTMGLVIKAAIAASTAGMAVLITLALCFRRKFTLGESMAFWKKKTKNLRDIEAFLKNCGSLSPKRYSYANVKKMTDSFKCKLGQGGYGCVYKGKLHEGGLVAVKVLNESKGSGEEFINEVASISRTSHVNIVTLLGFCFEGSKRALIYEFLPNGSLEKFIYDGNSLTNCQLGWETLYQIALGIAQGLEYLHRGCNTQILHFDIKPHNILLDEDFSPKISDFGLAKLCPRKESVISMLGARGTVGYIAPEVCCRSFGRVSHKSDVYNYGMMILEMVGGRKNINTQADRTSEIYFPHWIHKRLELGQELGLHGIINDEQKESARKMIIVGLWCIQINPSDRPPTSRVVDMLKGSFETLHMPPAPFLSSPSRSPVDSSSPRGFDSLMVHLDLSTTIVA